MKKNYSKPEIMFEDFSLSTNIASCSIKIEGHSQGACAYTIYDEFGGEDKVFLSEMGACSYKEVDGDYNGICYHSFADDKTLFNS